MARQQTGGRNKAVLFMVGSLIVAGAITLVIYRIIQRYQSAYDQALLERDNLVTVVVAAQDLYVGLSIAPEDLETRRVLPDTVNVDFVFETTDDVVNQVPRERILAGEAIRLERLASGGLGLGLNAIITPGRRAMTIETDTQSGMAGLLEPNNYVDVIVTIKPDDQGQTRVAWQTETILQYIKVLAVGDQLGRVDRTEDPKKRKKSRGKNSVTLEVTLDEAEKLALAASRGDLHIVLRSDVDILEQQSNGPLTSGSLLGLTNSDINEVAKKAQSKGSSKGTKAAKAEPTDPNYSSAEVVQGGSTRVEKFTEDGEKVEDSRGSRRRSP